MKPHAFLWADVAGLSLSQEDKDILSHPFISGVILFARNYESPAQLKALTREIKSVSPELIITVDQEGGRVQRFREGFTELPAMQYWGSAYSAATHEAAKKSVKDQFSKTLSVMMTELKKVGVDSTLVPVLDIDYDRNKVIGHRSLGDNPQLIVELSDFMIDVCHHLSMPVTGKHFPGHGWVTVDSHLDLPIDERAAERVFQNDLLPFKKLATKLDAIMLAHIIYQNIDPNPVCFSAFWIRDVLRTQLQFDGLIMSDDLSMQAVAKMGGYDARATAALEAGCDILLVCNAREGVITILDQVKPKSTLDFERRLMRYRLRCR